LASTLLAVFAVDRIIDYSKEMLNMVINSERMDIALKNVSASNDEYNKSLEFLNNTSEKYGQNINTLKESYTNFLASSKSSNLSLVERQKIYESIIQAGSTLQLSNDKIQGSLLAVSQMFSKGNVSAEELRGQLGERLPGAFGIMAEALGVNEKKLNKMLEQGEVLAKDALPKFAAALTNAYGANAQKNLETVAGQQNRVINSLTEYLNKKNDDLGITNKISSAYKFLADNLGSVVNATIGITAAVGAYILKQTLSNTLDKIKLINLGQEVLAKQAASAVTLELTAAETAAAAAATRFNTALAAAPWGVALLAITAGVTALMEYSDNQQRLYELTEKGTLATDASIKTERQHGIELGLNIEATKKLYYGTEERISAVKSLMAQYPQYFKNLTAEQVSNWHLTNAYKLVNAEIQTKITLMAREKSIEKQTNRLTDIKMELESMGVYVNTLREFNAEEQKRGLHINLNGPKIHALLKEQGTLTDNLIKSSSKLGDAQINQMNVELRANKAKYDSKQITLEQFKVEANRIQDVYNRHIKVYDLQKIEEPKVAEGKSKSNDKISKAEKAFLKQMQLEKEAFQQKISEIDNRGEEERAFEREKQANKIYPLYTSIYAKLQTAINNLSKGTSEAGEAYSKSLTDRITKDSQNIQAIIEESNKFFEEVKKNAKIDLEVEDLWNKTLEETKKEFEDRQALFEAAFETSFEAVSEAVDKFYEHFDKKSKEGETAAERQGAALNKAFLEPMKENVNAAKAFLSGDYLGAAKGIAGYFEGIWKTTFGLKKTLEEIRLNDFNLNWEQTMSNLESYSDRIKENFEGLADSSIEFNQTQKTGTDALIEAEIKRAGEIRNAYDLALSKEDELYNKAKSNEDNIYSTLKSNAESQFSKDIQDINDKYDLEISKINEKYDLISVKSSQRFDAESLAISEGVNNDLMKFVSNEDLKVALTDKYELEKGKIKEKFALAYVPITEGMSDAEIKGINDAIKARDEAFAKLADWQTNQIQFVITNGKLEIDTFTDVQKVIAKGKDDQYQLGLGYQAQQIIDETNKNIEIEGAEKTKNTNIESAAVAHKANMEAIELNHKTALQTIETNHNNELVRLGQEKDTALLNSFNALKDAMKAGYAEILQSASDAYTQGLITAEQYLSKLKEIQALRGLVGETTPSLTNEIRDRLRNLGIPGFKDGTELVGGQIGIDKNLAWLSHDEAVIKGETNRKKLQAGLTNESAIQYAISYKSILDGGFSPLALKDNILPKLEERAAMQYLLNMNTQPIIDELKEVRQTLSKLPLQKFVYDKDGVNQYEQTKNSVKIYRKKRFE